MKHKKMFVKISKLLTHICRFLKSLEDTCWRQWFECEQPPWSSAVENRRPSPPPPAGWWTLQTWTWSSYWSKSHLEGEMFWKSFYSPAVLTEILLLVLICSIIYWPSVHESRLNYSYKRETTHQDVLILVINVCKQIFIEEVLSRVGCFYVFSVYTLPLCISEVCIIMYLYWPVLELM